MPNIFAEFKKLFPDEPVIVCTVAGEHGDGTTSVTTLDGGALRVMGTNGRANGARVFVQGGKIIGDAPTLSASQFDV